MKAIEFHYGERKNTGRKDIRLDFLQKLEAHEKEIGHEFSFSSKEKWAGLRVDFDSADDYSFLLAEDLEVKSHSVCIECGRKGKVRVDLGRWQTLCKEHYLLVKPKQGHD